MRLPIGAQAALARDRAARALVTSFTPEEREGLRTMLRRYQKIVEERFVEPAEDDPNRQWKLDWHHLHELNAIERVLIMLGNDARRE